MCKLRHIKQVICNTSHDLTDFVVGIIGITECFQMRKGIRTHVRFNINTHDMSLRTHIVIGSRIDKTQHNIQTSQFSNQSDCQSCRFIHGSICQRGHDPWQYNVTKCC